MSNSKQWMKLQPLPSEFNHPAVSRINSSEFIIAEYKFYSDTDGWKIYKFNHDSSKLTPFIIDCIDDNQAQYYNMVYDKTTNKLYLYTWEDNAVSGMMTIIDINTKQFETSTNCFAECESGPNILSVQGTIHLIGGANNPKHYIWNNYNKSLEEIYHFAEYSAIFGASAFYLSSKDIIILIGGADRGLLSFEDINIGIWIFYLKNRTWKQIKTRCPWNIGRAVMTSDEKYIIIAAANNNYKGNDIFILDIRTDILVLKKSNICSPKEGYHQMVRTGDALKDEMLVIGFIKWLFNTNDFSDLVLPPFYIMQLIAKWYNTETIHWLEWNNKYDEENDHYTIPIKQILSSIDSNVTEETINIV